MSAHQSNQVFGLPVSFDAYIRHGWSLVAIPKGTKGPKTAGWNKRENALKDSTLIPPDHGVGLCHAYSGTCAIDIDAWDQAVPLLAEHGVDLNALYAAADAVTIDSGTAGHGKLIYAMPFGLTLPSKKITDLNGTVVYELRCASANGLTVQDVLPPSAHPSGTTYQWGGRGKWTDLPTLPVELLTLWQNLTNKDKERTITNGTLDASWDEIKSALYAINPECSRDDWLSCMMALHYAGTNTNQEAQAFHLADEWSSQAPTKYKGKQDIITTWKSFRDHPDGVKLGTLFHIAGQHGWKRPTPDVSEMFKSLPLQSAADVIDSLRFPAPDPDISLFPPVLQRRAQELAQGVGCDVLSPLWAGMAAIAGAMDARSRLELKPGFLVPPVLWVMTIGDPAEKKTHGATPMIKPLLKIEKEAVRQFRIEYKMWEAMDASYAKAKKGFLEAASNPDFLLNGANLDSLPPLADEPPKAPVDKRLVVKDITSQKLARMIADRQYGMLCHLDEMKTWVDKITDAKSGEGRSTWVEAYEAGHYVVDRVGEQNSIPVDNFALAIFGNIQPAVYRKAMTQMGDDGLLQRFVQVPLRQVYRDPGDPLPEMFTNSDEWETLLRTVHNLPITTYKLDSKASEIYREFQFWYARNKQDERLLQADNMYLQAYGKLEGLTGRIALVMHAMTAPYSPIVGYETMKASIDLIQSYVIPAYRFCLSEITGTLEQSLDVWVHKHIAQIASDTPTITLSDLRRSARRQVADMAPSEADRNLTYSMLIMERAGWVIKTNDSPRSTEWAINPAICQFEANYRLEVIKADQRRSDMQWTIACRTRPDTVRRIVRGYDPKTMD